MLQLWCKKSVDIERWTKQLSTSRTVWSKDSSLKSASTGITDQISETAWGHCYLFNHIYQQNFWEFRKKREKGIPRKIRPDMNSSIWILPELPGFKTKLSFKRSRYPHRLATKLSRTVQLLRHDAYTVQLHCPTVLLMLKSWLVTANQIREFWNSYD